MQASSRSPGRGSCNGGSRCAGRPARESARNASEPGEQPPAGRRPPERRPPVSSVRLRYFGFGNRAHPARRSRILLARRVRFAAKPRADSPVIEPLTLFLHNQPVLCLFLTILLGIDHRPVPFQGGRIRIRRRNPDCRHRDRDSGQAGTAGAAPLVVLLPVPVLDRLRGGPAVFRQPEERGAAANRAGPGRRGDRSRDRDRRQRGVRVRRRACGRHPVGRDDAVGRARDRPERDRRAADCRGVEGDPRRARPAGRRHHVWVRRSRPDSVPHVARSADARRRPETRGEGAGTAAGGRQAGRRRAGRDAFRSPRLSRRERGGVRRDAGGAGSTVCGGALVGAARPARSRPAGADAGPVARSRRPAGRVGAPRGVRQRGARNRTGAGRHVAAVGPDESGHPSSSRARR